MSANTHYVVGTAFHGGGIISRHQSEEAAERSLSAGHSRHSGDKMVFGVHHYGMGCRCGFGHVVTAERYDSLPIASPAASAYSAARDN